MAYSNDPAPNPYAKIPSPVPNIDFPKPYWMNKLANLLMIGCTNPDLAYAELVVPAAAKMFWTLITPGTKQIIEETTGQSWLCGSRQVLGTSVQGEQIAASDTGRFVYGLLAGLDIAAYHAFMVSTGAEGVIDFGMYAKKFQRICSQSQEGFKGIEPVYGAPFSEGTWTEGPSFLNSNGDLLGPRLTVEIGQVGTFVAWMSFSCLFITGGVVGALRIIDDDTGEVYDEDTVNNILNVSQCAIVRYATTEGSSPRQVNLHLQAASLAADEDRIVGVSGGCFKRAWNFAPNGFPPFWNMKTMLKASQET